MLKACEVCGEITTTRKYCPKDQSDCWKQAQGASSRANAAAKRAVLKPMSAEALERQVQLEAIIEAGQTDVYEKPSTVEEVMDSVSEDEKELWSGSRRSEGQPSKAMRESYKRRDSKILEVATLSTDSFSQSIRHIYYQCSGLGLVGKDHGKDIYWYTMVSNVIGNARWNGTLDWSRIADDSRPFTRPVFWESAADRMQSVVTNFAVDKWKGQKNRAIVVVEKDAILSMLSDLCRQYHVPIMSFHGQASDGGAIYELAKHIKGWQGECETVHCFYLGDFDTCGCVIDRVAFGDSEAYSESDDINDAYLGKVNRLVSQLPDYYDHDSRPPWVLYRRIGVTPYDVMNPRYDPYLLESNNDTNFERYAKDTSAFDDFPQMESFTSTGKSRGMVPATLGIDALDHVELIRRTKAAIKPLIDVEAWKVQRDDYKLHHKALKALL
jgi:hypothetical protein